MDLALNNLQGLICHKTQQTNQQLIFVMQSVLGGQFINEILMKPSVGCRFSLH